MTIVRKILPSPIVYVPRAPEIQLESPSCFVRSIHTDVGFEVLTAMTMKNTVFWVLLPCSMEKDQPFGGRKLHFQGRTVSQARNQQRQVASSASFGFLLVVLFFPEYGGTPQIGLSLILVVLQARSRCSSAAHSLRSMSFRHIFLLASSLN
jgi:hypothetical protein